MTKTKQRRNSSGTHPPPTSSPLLLLLHHLVIITLLSIVVCAMMRHRHTLRPLPPLSARNPPSAAAAEHTRQLRQASIQKKLCQLPLHNQRQFPSAPDLLLLTCSPRFCYNGPCARPRRQRFCSDRSGHEGGAQRVDNEERPRQVSFCLRHHLQLALILLLYFC
jgi:hypothetical protein